MTTDFVATRTASPSGLVNWLTSTDHKVIGISYMITSIVIFYLAGIMALLLRLQLASPHSSLAELFAVQRVVHHARQSDAVLVRRAVRLRWPGQLHRALADRGARHGFPTTQCVELLAVPQWFDHNVDGVFCRRRGASVRMGVLCPALERDKFSGRRTRSVDHGDCTHRVLRHLHRSQLGLHHLLPTRSRA